MPKRTKKYVKALAAAQSSKISTEGDSNQLYNRLQEEANLWWNIDKQVWEKGEKPKPASGSIYVRVCEAEGIVETHAARIIELLQEDGYHLINASEPYRCRPPKQNESRIYAKFLPPQTTK